MDLKELRTRILWALTDDLRRPEYRGDPNPLTGHCYVASEAAYHLLGGKKSLWKPMFMYWAGRPHWFLKHKETGQVLDLTWQQFVYVPDHTRGKGKGFLTRKPSKRARIAIKRAKEMPQQ